MTRQTGGEAVAPAYSVVSVLRTTTFHLLALGVFWVGVSRAALLVFFASYYVRSLAISLGYHRYFSHRTFETSRAFQALLAFVGSMAGQKGPLTWATSHRSHHETADTCDDPHSPRHGGFFHAHLGWVLRKESLPTSACIAAEFSQAPEILFFNRYPNVGFGFFLIVLLGIGIVLGDVARVMIWGGVLSTLLLLHTTGFINSVLHSLGSRPYGTHDDSRNLLFLLPFAIGENWHNNHHRYPGSANTALLPGQVDPAFVVLSWFSALGLVWNVRSVPQERTS
jgi:stearoyl-CoA desaturase (delta-9 desaturase)